MRLKYYLRGLGIGMVVTALIMGVALKGDRSLSDAEIRVRAMELGMVDGDSRTLADIQASQESEVPSPDVSEPTGTPEDTAGATPTPTPEPDTTPAASSDSPLKPLPMVTLKPPQGDSADAAGTESSSIPEEVSTTEPLESTSFEIHSGQSSYTVSKALVEAGLVEDALEFDHYLEENGYSKRISPGTYEIPLNSTQEEIAKIITRSR